MMQNEGSKESKETENNFHWKHLKKSPNSTDVHGFNHYHPR